MNTIARLAACMVLLTAPLLGCHATESAQGESGWTPLFNGSDLAGWHTSPGGEWAVIDATIVGTSPASERRHGLLISDNTYSDFEARLQFNVTQGDSGFYFRATPVDHPVGIRGFQAEVDTTLETGGLYETLGRAWVIKPDPAVMQGLYTPDQWTDMTVRAVAGNITVTINNTTVCQLTDDPGARQGHFALQLHGGQDMHVAYRDIRIHELTSTPETE